MTSDWMPEPKEISTKDQEFWLNPVPTTYYVKLRPGGIIDLGHNVQCEDEKRMKTSNGTKLHDRFNIRFGSLSVSSARKNTIKFVGML